ncbi:glycoside hydrolase family 73 protein [Paenibacillus selenitireducens]|uniref:glycoside hydrolase family 73 protein n=1 Tax=Paenibacillus selenitireducens TaxID=1324314 RepID=UPI0026A8B8D3
MKASDFIAKIVPHAVRTMHQTGVPASLTIAQAILESSWGDSGLTRKGNALFGIKGSGPAGSGLYKTKEFVNGKWIEIMAPFRHYHDWGESVDDHAKLNITGTRDKPKRYHGVLVLTIKPRVMKFGAVVTQQILDTL